MIINLVENGKDISLLYENIYEVTHYTDGSVVLQFHIDTEIKNIKLDYLEVVFKNKNEFLDFVKNSKRMFESNKDVPFPVNGKLHPDKYTNLTIEIMPKTAETDMKKLVAEIKKTVKQHGIFVKHELQPVGFGINKLIVQVSIDDETTFEKFKKVILNVSGIKRVQIIDFTEDIK